MISWEYLAGFIDGEGNIDLKQAKGGALKVRVRWTLKRESADLVFPAIAELLDAHGVRFCCWTNRMQGREYDVIEIVHKESVKQVLLKILPFLLSEKKGQAGRLLDAMERWEVAYEKYGVSRYDHFTL